MLTRQEENQVQLFWIDPITGFSEVRLETPPITLGRSKNNIVVLADPQVSIQHARLEVENGQLIVIDHHSAAGTLLDGKSISRAVLPNQSELQIGPFLITVTFFTPAEVTDQSELFSLHWTDPQSGESRSYSGSLPISLGRHSENSIVLDGEQISRWHAVIAYENEQITLVDQNSKNGTLLNESLCRREPILGDGEQIQLGSYQFRFYRQAGSTLDEPDPRHARTHTHLARRASSELEPAKDFVPAFFGQQQVSIRTAIRSNMPVSQTTYLTVGGGLGSFAWVDYLRICGVGSSEITVIGAGSEKPYGRYQQLCNYSQIPEHERLRSNSDSRPDNLWGWPGYAVQEIFSGLRQVRLGHALKTTWQIFGEPTLAQTYTPRSADVFTALDREAQRIGWEKMWRYGRVRAIRKTNDDRYIVAYSQTRSSGQRIHKLLVAKYLHLAVGYPAIRLLKDIQAFRETTSDFKTVVNAYEDHEHIYKNLKEFGGVILLRGRGIVASRIIQRLDGICQNANGGVRILHLMRTPLESGNTFGQAARPVKGHWEFQPFNWPKACWGGTLRTKLINASQDRRQELLSMWGGTTTAYRQDWQEILDRGQRQGWYQIRFGKVNRLERTPDGKVNVVLQGNLIPDQTQLQADYVIDATGLIAGIDANPLLKDLHDCYQFQLTGQKPSRQILVNNAFEIDDLRNGSGRMYASGIATLGGPYAPVDSFLGLQYAAQQSVDDLTRQGAPGLRYLNGLASLAQWLRWIRGVHP